MIRTTSNRATKPETTARRLVVFTLDGQRYALSLEEVEQVLAAAEVTRLPAAPEIVLGAIDFRGRVLPVIDMRRRFRLPERELLPSDDFLLARRGQRTFALAVDEVEGVVECAGEVVAAESVVPGLGGLQGVAALEDGLVLIHDLDALLSLEEERALDGALEEMETA